MHERLGLDPAALERLEQLVGAYMEKTEPMYGIYPENRPIHAKHFRPRSAALTLDLVPHFFHRQL